MKSKKPAARSTPVRKAAKNDEEPRRAKKVTGSGATSTPQQNASPSSSVVSESTKTILPEGKNSACLSEKSELSLAESTSDQSLPTVSAISIGAKKVAILKYRKTDKSGSSSYSIDGLKSSVYFNKGMFPGAPPAEIPIEGVEFSEPGSNVKVGIAKLTPEERKANAEALKAKRDAMSPAEKAAARLESARAALAAAEKAAAKASEMTASV